jgi:hypothetical protein
MTQYNLKPGLRKFGERGATAERDKTAGRREGVGFSPYSGATPVYVNEG